MKKWDELPKEIQQKMLDRQEEQGNKRDAEVFKDDVSYGYNWEKTPEGHDFWLDVLGGNFDLFFQRYQKKEYPRVMMVSDDPITPENKGRKRVVFAEKCGRYIAWVSAKTIKEAEKEFDATSWRYAAEITQETPEQRELAELKKQHAEISERIAELEKKLK